MKILTLCPDALRAASTEKANRIIYPKSFIPHPEQELFPLNFGSLFSERCPRPRPTIVFNTGLSTQPSLLTLY